MELDFESLDIVVSDLPKYPPLKPGGETTIKEMLPELTEEELEYIYSKYDGYMKLK